MSAPIPLMIGTALSRNPGILASKGNPASYGQADGRNNKSSVPPDWKPWPDLGLDSCGLVPKTFEK